MVFRANETPIETATPTAPKPPASEIAPARLLMVEESSAVSVTLAAEMPSAPSPSMNAAVSTPITFSANTPEPAPAMPTPPAPTATAPAITIEPMVWVASAVWRRSPVALTLVSCR